MRIKLFFSGKYKSSNEKAVLKAVTKSFDIKTTQASSKKGTFVEIYTSGCRQSIIN